MACISLVQWRSGGRKTAIDHSHRYFSIIFLAVLPKGMLEKIIFKWVPLKKKEYILKETKLSAKEMCIQSDNETCFYSQDIFLFLFHLNTVSSGPTIKRWILLKQKL